MNLNKNYTYMELETLGELLISLPGICQMEGADDVSSSEIIGELTRVACDFEEEWNKLSFDEHDELGEDWRTEIDKLADWIKEHLYDVLHNQLEYGGYQAKKAVYEVVHTGFGGVTSERFSTPVEAAMWMIKYASMIAHDSDGTMTYRTCDEHNDNLPSISAHSHNRDYGYKVTKVLVPKTKETT